MSLMLTLALMACGGQDVNAPDAGNQGADKMQGQGDGGLGRKGTDPSRNDMGGHGGQSEMPGAGNSGTNTAGATGTTGGSSGAKCGAVTCGAGQRCDSPEGQCGKDPAGGSCQIIPEVCKTLFDPVCGCDNKTYSNDCARQGAGVNLLHKGECKVGQPPGNGEGASCGLIDGRKVSCDDGLYCDNPVGQCGLVAVPLSPGDASLVVAPDPLPAVPAPPTAQTGTCARQPKACTKELRPVCGCDGKTYNNDCERQSAGVSLQHTGACENNKVRCEQLEKDYPAAVSRAQSCSLKGLAQCQAIVRSGLRCPLCSMVVNDTTELDAMASEYRMLGCKALNNAPCPVAACLKPNPGMCVASTVKRIVGISGVCQGFANQF